MAYVSECKRDEFIESNLGLAHSCANRFKGRGIEYDDLFQAACFGLIKAYDGFDCGRGVRFSTYAVPVILGEIKQLFRDGGTVKVSLSLRDIARKANCERERIARLRGEEPSLSELATLLECDNETLVEAICASRAPISLTIDDEQGTREQDVAVMTDDEGIAERLSLGDAVEKLNENERAILLERYFKSKTQAETARLLGTTQVQISRNEKKIIEKLRYIMR